MTQPTRMWTEQDTIAIDKVGALIDSGKITPIPLDDILKELKVSES